MVGRWYRPFSDVEDARCFHDHHSELIQRAADADVVERPVPVVVIEPTERLYTSRQTHTPLDIHTARHGVRTLNHTTFNHRPSSNIPISDTDDDQNVVKITAQPCFPLKRGIIMKRGHAGCIARTTNAVEGWYFGLQAYFRCHKKTRSAENLGKNLRKTYDWLRATNP